MVASAVQRSRPQGKRSLLCGHLAEVAVTGLEPEEHMLLFQHPFRRTADIHLAPARGARAALAMLLPLVVIEEVGPTHIGSNVAVGMLLGVLFVAFCDLGPSLRIRVQAMTVGMILGAFLLGLGSAIGGPWWVPVPVLALATLLSGLLSVYSPAVVQVGVILNILLAVALGRDGGPSAARLSALGFLCGGALFLLLTLVSAWLGNLLPRAGPPSQAAGPPPRATPRAPLTLRSPMVRFALLRAVGTALIAGLAWGSGLPYPQWAPVVVIGSVRPDQMVAMRLTTQRVIGTVLGAGLADVVLSWIQDPRILAGLAVVVVFLAFTVKDASYTLFMFFLTILTLLLINIPSPGPTHAVLRVVAALVGGAAAVGLSWLSAWLVRHAVRTPHPPPESSPGEAVT